jgi:hypothetical protein
MLGQALAIFWVTEEALSRLVLCYEASGTLCSAL